MRFFNQSHNIVPRTYLSIPGHVPVKEAAAQLHLSEERILQHIHAGHLAFTFVDGRYMIPLDALERMERRPHGQTRKKPVAWRRYRAGATVHTWSIDVRAFAGQEEALQDRWLSLESLQEHLFPGTMQRYILASPADPAQITILLIWKDTELTNEENLHHDLEIFKAAFAELLDWPNAHIAHRQALAYT